MDRKILGCLTLSLAATGAAWACTGMYAGRRTTAGGHAIVARTVDLGKPTATMRTAVTPRVENAPGRFWGGVDGFRRALPATTRKIVSTPRASADGRGMFDSCVLNEDGLAISATVTGLTNDGAKKADPFVGTGAREESLPGYIGLTCGTAREAVELAGRIIAEQGNAEPNIYLFMDPKEAWYLETYTGHEWAAVRMPEDKVAFFGNHFCLGGVDPKADGVLVSPGLYARAEKAGLTVKDPETGFVDLAATYGDGKKRNSWSNLRSWWGRHLWADEPTELYGSNKRYPLFFTPTKKLTLRDFFEATRARYEGERWCPEETTRRTERMIGTELTATAHVIEMRPELPPAYAATAWVALANAEHSVYLPIWAAVTSVPEDYARDYDDPTLQKGTQAAENNAESPEAGKITFNKRLAGGRYRRLCALAELNRRLYGDGVRSFWRAREDELLAKTEALLVDAAKDPAGAAAKLTAFSTAERMRALADAKRLFDDLMAYVILYNSTNPQKNFQVPFLRKARVVAVDGSSAGAVTSVRPEADRLNLLGRVLGPGYAFSAAGMSEPSRRDILAWRPDLVLLRVDESGSDRAEALRRLLPPGCVLMEVKSPPLVDEGTHRAFAKAAYGAMAGKPTERMKRVAADLLP